MIPVQIQILNQTSSTYLNIQALNLQVHILVLYSYPSVHIHNMYTYKLSILRSMIISFTPNPRHSRIREGRIQSTYTTSTYTTSQFSSSKSCPLFLNQDPFRSERVKATPLTKHLHIQILNHQIQNLVIYS